MACAGIFCWICTNGQLFLQIDILPTAKAGRFLHQPPLRSNRGCCVLHDVRTGVASRVSHGTVCISLSGLLKPFTQNVNGSVFVAVVNRVTRRAFPFPVYSPVLLCVISSSVASERILFPSMFFLYACLCFFNSLASSHSILYRSFCSAVIRLSSASASFLLVV